MSNSIPTTVAEIDLATGKSRPGSCLRAGGRNVNLRRLFNGKPGISRKDDTLPPRLGIHDKGSGGGGVPAPGKMLADYHRLRGWSPEGIPLPQKCLELGLSP